jgi:hypothetical protein
MPLLAADAPGRVAVAHRRAAGSAASWDERLSVHPDYYVLRRTGLVDFGA